MSPAAAIAAQRQTQREPEHKCTWQQQSVALVRTVAEQSVAVAQLQDKVADQARIIDLLNQQLHGKKSEKLPRPEEALRKRGDVAKITPEDLKKKRADGRKWKEELPVEDSVCPLPANLPTCPECKCVPSIPATPEVSFTTELVPERLKRIRHIIEKVKCKCGCTVVTAPPPARVGEQGQYGPVLAADVVVKKCCDSLAIERIATQFRRMGLHLSPSTLLDLFHTVARVGEPLYKALVAGVQTQALVLADETRIQVQQKGKTRRAWMWVFIAGDSIVYVFSPSRSGETPVAVLGASKGTLVVDAYTGYNQVTKPADRERGGCMAHGRRGVFAALKYAPSMQVCLDLILDLYKVEHDARAAGIVGTAAHGTMRRERSTPIMDKLHAWLTAEQPLHLPKSPAGEAVGYMLNQWDHLKVFLGNPKAPLDNNASERALRVVARGRDSYLFIGNDEAGRNLATLLTLVHSAQACGKNPRDYLADVLIRLPDYKASRLAELLPQNWQSPVERALAVAAAAVPEAAALPAAVAAPAAATASAVAAAPAVAAVRAPAAAAAVNDST